MRRAHVAARAIGQSNPQSGAEGTCHAFFDLSQAEDQQRDSVENMDDDEPSIALSNSRISSETSSMILLPANKL